MKSYTNKFRKRKSFCNDFKTKQISNFINLSTIKHSNTH
jgi:hypothetical protein